jgi:putative pyruvate formate lyase activating enzyme
MDLMEIDAVEKILASCDLCPRNCHVNRTMGRKGFCGAGIQPKIARIALHHWEEPPISGTNGSGTVFFSHCNLKCCFCQNYKISHEGFGREVSVPTLAQKFIQLQSQGAHNINLITGAPYVPQIAQAIRIARDMMGLTIPIVYNTSAYEKVDTLRMLEGLVNIYIPDLKYTAPELGNEYCEAPNYFAVASSAILEMIRQCGPVVVNDDGIMQSGVLVRHLVMPGRIEDSFHCLEWIKYNLGDDVYTSIMAQYIPFYHADKHPEISRKLTSEEYHRVVNKVEELDFANGFIQELEAASEDYIPEFDLTGV